MRLLALATLLLALAAPLCASAQTNNTEVERAEQLYGEAITAFRSGDNVRAAELFRASYELVPKPELLYNESVALARGGDLAAARHVADEALTRELEPRVHAKVRARLVAWDLLAVAPTRAIAQTTVADATPTASKIADPVVVTAEEPPRRSGVRIASYVVGGLGLVALGTAGVMEWRVASSARELEVAAAERDLMRYEDELRQGRRLQTVGRSTLIAGGLLVGTAIVLWIVSKAKRVEAQALLRF